MKVLSLLKAFDGKPINAVGAAWAGCCLNNELINHPEIECLDIITKLDHYDAIDPRIGTYEVEVHPRRENKELMEIALQIYDEGGYDVLHLHVGSLGMIKWIAELVSEHVNVVYTLHTPTMLGKSKMTYGSHGKMLNGRKNVRIVGPSDHMQNVWHEFTSEDGDIDNLCTAYNGTIDHNIELKPFSMRNGRIVMCGRLTPMKRVKEALDFVSKYNIPTVYIGDSFDLKNGKPDDYYEYCKDILENSDNIEWIRYATNDEVVKIISESDYLFTLSDQESFGLTVAEALSVGTPIIYSTGGAVEEVASEEVGFKMIFEPRTKWTTRFKYMNEFLENALNQRDDKFSPEQLRQYYLDRYTMSKMADRYIEIYESFGK